MPIFRTVMEHFLISVNPRILIKEGGYVHTIQY